MFGWMLHTILVSMEFIGAGLAACMGTLLGCIIA
jgi:hypothetical protein